MKPVTTETRPQNLAPKAAEPLIELPSQVAQLSNGRYTVQLTGVGSGRSECCGRAISRWQDDATRDADGFYIYLRDLDDNFVWSAGYQPKRIEPSRYQFSVDRGVAEIVRCDRSVECRLAVCVAPSLDLEIRRCTLTNHGKRHRSIELTSYMEWVLCSQEADANHPAFSKLFVETQVLPDRGAILAKRRPRGGDEVEVWGFHTIVTEPLDSVPAPVQFETNRAAFIGRGRNLSRPLALDPGRVLSGQAGPVLDPIGSLRTAVRLEPGETREISFSLGFSHSRSDVDIALARIESSLHIEEIFAQAAVVESINGKGPSSAYRDRPNAAGHKNIFHPSHRRDGREATPPNQTRYQPSNSGDIHTNGHAERVSKPLQFDNGYGGFSADGREYCLRIQPNEAGDLRLPPRPWVNVIANERAGFLVTESGAGYTWVGNSRLNRLTAWHNDPVSDPHAEAIWVRDEDEQMFWSPTPGPTPARPNIAFATDSDIRYSSMKATNCGTKSRCSWRARIRLKSRACGW